jgi:predicted site-specific integrase-resolvase
MTATQPQVEATGRYSISDTAIKLGVSKRTIERYITAGKIKAQYRKANSKPFVTGLEIVKAWQATY